MILWGESVEGGEWIWHLCLTNNIEYSRRMVLTSYSYLRVSE